MVPDTAGIELVHPAGRETAAIVYRERVRPLVRVGAIVQRIMTASPGVRWDARPVLERLLTEEGEHAAFVTLGGVRGDRPVRCHLGIVFGDDFYALTAGTCHEPARFDELGSLVRDLTLTDRHGLGIRRRRFVYSAPREWTSLIHGFVTEWFPPDYPNDSVWLTAYPANPTTMSGPAVLRMMADAYVGEGTEVVDEVMTGAASDAGLSGTSLACVVRSATSSVFKRITVLSDQHYFYVLEITAGSRECLTAHEVVLGQTVASVEPIPSAKRLRPHELMAHWAE